MRSLQTIQQRRKRKVIIGLKRSVFDFRKERENQENVMQNELCEEKSSENFVVENLFAENDDGIAHGKRGAEEVQRAVMEDLEGPNPKKEIKETHK